MIILTWNPPNNGTPVVFSRDATDYRLLKNYTGFASIPGEHVYADKAPARHGQKRKYTTLKQRPVSFDITIQSTDLDQLQTLVQALSSTFNPLDGPGVLQYQKENGDVYYLNCIGVQGNPELSTDKTQTYQKATIRLVADEDPFWHSGSPSIEYFDPNPGNYFPFPNGTGVWPWVLSAKNKTKSLTNTGSIDAPIIVTFTGPGTNPALENVKMVKGVEVTETLSATLTLAAGESLVINTDPEIMTARYYTSGGGSVNAHKYIDTASKFLQLGRGVNTVTFNPATSSTGSLASVEWSNRFVGV